MENVQKEICKNWIYSIIGFITQVKHININIIHTYCFVNHEAIILKILPQELKVVLH